MKVWPGRCFDLCSNTPALPPPAGGYPEFASVQIPNLHNPCVAVPPSDIGNWPHRGLAAGPLQLIGRRPKACLRVAIIDNKLLFDGKNIKQGENRPRNKTSRKSRGRKLGIRIVYLKFEGWFGCLTIHTRLTLGFHK